MFFSKYPSPANFSFAQTLSDNNPVAIGNREVNLDLANYESGIGRLTFWNNDIWPSNLCLDPLSPLKENGHQTLKASSDQLTIQDKDGNPLLKTVPNQGIGLNDKAWCVQFQVPQGCRYYGMGQKLFGELELSGYRTVFWNTDVWSDFHWAQWGENPSDPPYFSTPYLAIKLPEGGYVGILLHDPATTFMETPGKDDSRVFVEWQRTSEHLVLGAYDGEPNLWFVTGDTIKEITQKINLLVGTTPTPPLWSLGYHQSRWGYGGEKDLLDLDMRFTEAQIPCSGLWLDLDYMTGYRIFKTNPKMFPNGVQSVADKLAKNGRRIVPIIDPGVKHEPGYHVYDDGHKNKVFCLNKEGNEFIGMVWPGHTVFPDFTQVRVRDWWAGYCNDFLKEGFGACWVDMNDPSTGPINPHDMLFDDGRRAHLEHRNQYALGMQMATQQGFLKGRPNERPFILSRSGFIGSSRYCAVWHGDNVSNDFYLKSSITTTIGMGLSGHVFTGADIGGFGGDCPPRLMERWCQANFLFPFFRNHSTAGTKHQEPFAYPKNAQDTIGHYIRLRYRFLPYLYSLFAQHETQGDPIVRPLFYHYEQGGLDEITDQFMVGPWLLQAPVVEHESEHRRFRLPGRRLWMDARSGDWIKPGTHDFHVARQETLLFFKAGAIVPIQPEEPTTTEIDLNRPVILITVPETYQGTTEDTYIADDGISFDYQQGKRSEIKITVTGTHKGLNISWKQTKEGYGEIKPRFVTNVRHGAIKVNGKRVRKQPYQIRLTGRILAFRELI